MNPRTLARDLAGRITPKVHFARNGGGTLRVYRNRVCKPDGELLVRQRVKHRLLDEDCSEMEREARARLRHSAKFLSARIPIPTPSRPQR